MKGRKVLRTALPWLILVGGSGAIAGCGGSSTNGPKAPEPSAAQIERSEEVAQKGQEAAELNKERELLSTIEAKKQEEVAEAKAKKIEAEATKKAKKKEAAATKKAKQKEKAAEANAKKIEETAKAEAKKLKEASSSATGIEETQTKSGSGQQSLSEGQ